MIRHYALSPEGQSDGVVLYHDSLHPPRRVQSAGSERHGTIEGATPAADPSGLEPGTLLFEGYWLGADAGDIADKLRSLFFDDPSTTEVSVQALDGSGSEVSSPYNGTYLLADIPNGQQTLEESAINVWHYWIPLIED